jgi:uncharacterized protein
VLAIVVSGSVALAQEAPLVARHVPSAPDPRHVFVLDSAHILSAATIAALQDSARALQAETKADVVWVTLPTLGGRSVEEAALYIGRAWKIGSAGAPGDPLRNRGLVILYIPDKTQTAGPNFRIEVGNGLEGTITDARSRSITTAMREDLRAKRYDAAYLAGWPVAAALVRRDYAAQAAGRALSAQTPTPKPVAQRGKKVVGVVIVVALVAFVSIVAIVLIVASQRSPKRGKKRGRRRGAGYVPAIVLADDDDSHRRSSHTASADSGSSSSSDGGSTGGGGGFSGGGSSDTI